MWISIDDMASEVKINLPDGKMQSSRTSWLVLRIFTALDINPNGGTNGECDDCKNGRYFEHAERFDWFRGLTMWSSVLETVLGFGLRGALHKEKHVQNLRSLHTQRNSAQYASVYKK